MPRSRVQWVFLLLAGFINGSVQGQSNKFRSIEARVYQYNNALQYAQSQALLLPFLNNPDYSADEHYQAAVLLSYTYKRLLDYTTTLQFLDEAEQLSSKTSQPDSNKANVQAQKAYVYFDTHAYAKADDLMKRIAKLNFRYIDQEDKAKLVHQQGYLLFLEKRYREAEVTYDQALVELRAASGCDQPMILVKKMQLYAAMNRMDLALGAFKQSNRCADSCGILKYQIYAYNELSIIYKKRNDIAGFAATAQMLDSLNQLYARSENIATLHNQKEAIKQQISSYQLKDQLRKNWLAGGVGLLGLMTVLVIGLFLYRKQRQQLEDEKARIRAELDQRVATTHSAPTYDLPISQAYIDKLSDRQRQVLTYLVKGIPNREIADSMCVSENTVKYHIKNIYDELGVKSRQELLVRLRQ